VKNAAIYEGKVLLRETPGIFHRFAPVGGLVCGTRTAHPLRESDGQFDWQPCAVCFPAPVWTFVRTHSALAVSPADTTEAG
jgi:hypothetical protein